MIFQPLINLISYIICVLLEHIPVLSLSMPEKLYDALDILFSSLGYLLPVKALLPILVISGIMQLSRLAVAIIVRIKSFIPTMGN